MLCCVHLNAVLLSVDGRQSGAAPHAILAARHNLISNDFTMHCACLSARQRGWSPDRQPPPTPSPSKTFRINPHPRVDSFKGGGVPHGQLLSIVCLFVCSGNAVLGQKSPGQITLKVSSQRNETETKQFKNCFKTVLKLFCFISLCGQFNACDFPSGEDTLGVSSGRVGDYRLVDERRCRSDSVYRSYALQQIAGSLV